MQCFQSKCIREIRCYFSSGLHHCTHSSREIFDLPCVVGFSGPGVGPVKKDMIILEYVLLIVPVNLSHACPSFDVIVIPIL